MTGAEIRKQAFEHIQTHPYLWRKWNDAREEYQRAELMAEVIVELVSEFCIGEMYANQEDVSIAAERIRIHYDRE